LLPSGSRIVDSTPFPIPASPPQGQATWTTFAPPKRTSLFIADSMQLIVEGTVQQHQFILSCQPRQKAKFLATCWITIHHPVSLVLTAVCG
jgi:hypothetical protein